MVNPVSGRDGAGRAKAATSSIAVDFQSLLSVANRRQFLQGSTRAVLPAGTIALQPGGPSLAYFIEAGLARAFWSLPDGRQTTVAIIRPKEFVGAAVAMGQPPWIFMQLVTESTLTILDSRTSGRWRPRSWRWLRPSPYSKACASETLTD
jgi:CRP-like cAMP-binding protein